MSRVALDFLEDSLLFRDGYLSDGFASVSADEVQRELDRYREHVTGSLEAVSAEVTGQESLLSAFFDTSGRGGPGIDSLKQTSLYFDSAVVDDPLFELSQRPSQFEEAPSKVLGYRQRGLDREKVAAAAQFMKELTPMVAPGFLKFSPISFDHEPADPPPILFSESLFAEGVPPELLSFFWDRADVHPLRKDEGGGWSYKQGDPLVPCRGIAVEFSGLDELYVFHLFASEVLSVHEETRLVKTAMTLPDEPPDPEEFGAWVTQSVNQTAHRVLRRVLSDITRASLTNSLVCTRSPLVAELLSYHDEGPPGDLKADVARLSLDLELPIVEGASVADLMSVRADHGEALRGFRLALERQLKALRSIEDPEERRRRMEEVRHELEEVQLREVKREVRKVQRDLFGEGAAAAGVLGVFLTFGGAAMAGLFPAALAMYKTARRYFEEVRAHPAYFLWQIQKRGRWR